MRGTGRLKRLSLRCRDSSAYDIQEPRTETKMKKYLGTHEDKSRSTDSELHKSKRRKSSVEREIYQSSSYGIRIKHVEHSSFTGNPVLGIANGAPHSFVPSAPSKTPAPSVMSRDRPSRSSRRTSRPTRSPRFSKALQGDSLRIPSRSSLPSGRVFANEAGLAVSEACRGCTVEPKMWTDEYSPASVSEMILHSNDIAPLVEWMKHWDAELQTAGTRTSSSSSVNKPLRNKIHALSLTESLSSWRRSAYLIFGPIGCGKTSLVYALATQYGYKVFEMNPSSCRSGREVTSQCSPVMLSQHVSTESLLASHCSSDVSEGGSTFAPIFLSRKRSLLQSIPHAMSMKSRTSGLKLINKSLILFDDVDLLFDTDRGFWHAVGKLLQMGRRPIFFTASDPSVLREIPVPYRTCKLLPLTSSTLVKPVLQRICDSRGLILTDSLMLALTRREKEDCSFDIPGRISSTASELVNNQEFSDIRHSVVRLQWFLGSGYQCLDNESTKMSGYDLISANTKTFYRLFSLSLNIPRDSSQDPTKPIGDEFADIFASDAEKEPPKSEEHEGQTETSAVVRLPIAQCEKLSVDVLSELCRATESQAILDMCSAVCGRNEISRGIESLPLSIRSSPNMMTSFGDFCSAPLSGIDPVGINGTFACEEEWRRLLHLTTSRNFTRLEQQLLTLPVDSGSLAFGSYVDEHSTEDSFSSAAFAKAVGSLASLRAFNAEQKLGDSFLQRESALDLLPSLRSIGRAERYRKGLATRRRFFHYFDRIGLRLPQDVCEFLSQ